MSERVDMRSFERERAEFSGRVSALRAAHERSPESAPAILEAAFSELCLAEREFEVCSHALEGYATEPVRLRSPAEREQRLLRAVFQRPAGGGAGDDAGLDEEMAVISARRLDVMARMTRLLLDEESLQEPVALHRAARLLAGEYAEWVVVDLVRDEGVRRAVVVGPDEGEGAVATQALEEIDPGGVPLTRDVLHTSSPALHTLIEDDEMLGRGPGVGPVLTLLRATSVLAVPLRDEHDEHDDLGVLTLIRGVGRGRFDLADLGLLEELGEHLGLALRTERSYQRRTEAAQALQTSLLPRSLPSVPGLDVAAGYRAATEGVEVGGDFYDVFESPGGWGVVLGDVCGKGEEAAVVTAMVRHGARLLGLSEPDPAAVLRTINHAMVVQHETDRFVTAVAAHLTRDNEAVQMRLASAGHPPPVVLRADGTVRFTAGGGVPLGVFDDAEPHTETLTLAPGDMLLLYSDGVTETRDREGGLFGDGRLADVLARTFGLSASAVVKAIEDELHGFGDGRAHDDVALLAVRAVTG